MLYVYIVVSSNPCYMHIPDVQWEDVLPYFYDVLCKNCMFFFWFQKDRVELQRTFASWKLRHTDDKRESFTTTLARRHYHKKVKGRVWEAWFGLVQSRWKQRVEKACQVMSVL